MPTFVVVGAGRQGCACGAFLVEHVPDAQVLFLDQDPEALSAACALQKHPDRVRTQCLDLGRNFNELGRLLDGAQCLISCVPYFFNERLTDLAITAGVHFTDLGGNKGTVQRQLQRDAQARQRGVSIVPDCGLAPGLLNILAERWHQKWTYRSVRLYCGGLPQRPRGLLRHELTFSIWGLLNEYLDQCEVSRGGEVQLVEGLGEIEALHDLPIEGDFEAFATSGGSSMAPQVYAPKGIDYEYKTIRYTGHRNIYAGMRELGLFDQQPRTFELDGQSLTASAYNIVAALMAKSVPTTRADLVLARAEVRGEFDGKPVRGRIDLVDYADDRFTAMERTTGFPTAILAAAQAGCYGQPVPPGAHVPFQVLTPELAIRELGKAGVTGIREQTYPPEG